jgi:DNA-binding MarR family transcriptional regulator
MPKQALAGPARFDELMRRSKRNTEASRTAVSILRADAKVSQALEREMSCAGLTLPQFNVLMELASSERGQMPLYELNSRLITTPPSTSWLTSRMEKDGLVVKDRCAPDSRVVILKLTERGWSVLEKAAPLVFEAEKKLLAPLSHDELCQLSSLLDPVIKHCEQAPRDRKQSL